MFRRNITHPFSFVSILVIALAYLLVHYTGSKASLSYLGFLLYLAIFISGIGLTRKTLLYFFPDLTVAITILALAFGTNLFYMVSLDFRLQPILLFSLYATVVFLTASWHRHQKQVYALLLAVALSLIILLQPTGILSLLIPVFWGVHDMASWKSKILLLKNHRRQGDLFLSCMAISVLIPVIFLNLSPGEIPFFSFRLPGVFYSFSSWLWNDLFSFDHGWFLYTPLIVFAFIGFYFFAEKNRPLFYPVFLFCILDLFLESSWSRLGTTPVFGQFAFLPAYALLVFPMASLFVFIRIGKPVIMVLITIITVALIILNIFQTWQFNNGMILPSGMTADKYVQVFGRTGLTELEKQKLAGADPDTTFVLKDKTRFRKINLATYDFEDPDISYQNKLESNYVKSGKMAFRMDSTARFSPAFDTRYQDFTGKSRVGLKITASVFVKSPGDFSDVNLVITSSRGETNYRYKRLNLGDLKLKPGVWNTVTLDYLISADPFPEDKLVSYVWYTGNAVIYIDDLTYEAFEREK